MPGQTSISESLKRIHEALYLEPAPSARARRRTAPVELRAYDCPTHGQACFVDSSGKNAKDRRDRTCSYLKSWIKREALPSDNWGKLPRQVEYSEDSDEDEPGANRPTGDFLGCPPADSSRSRNVTIIRFALAELPDRARTILQYLHGIDCEPLTRDEVARRVGLTPKQVDKAAAEAMEMVEHQVRLLL
jgi:hypothetical protein